MSVSPQLQPGNDVVTLRELRRRLRCGADLARRFAAVFTDRVRGLPDTWQRTARLEACLRAVEAVSDVVLVEDVGVGSDDWLGGLVRAAEIGRAGKAVRP